MMTMMTWSTLFSPRRSGDAPDKHRNPDPLRTSYQRDYDRLIFSSAFRRLQNKTQVFPLPGAVFVHNRLTHSLEVASVGRSIARIVGGTIADKHFAPGTAGDVFYRHELQNVIAAAGLAHDIGNPPFGHSGEDAIRAYFAGECGPAVRSRLEESLTPEQLLDFERFEGNSNALRILTHPYAEEEAGGYNLTLSTLAAIVKYPCTAGAGFDKGKLSAKKSGFFESESATYTALAAELRIPAQGPGRWARHPFVFLTEAADDLCYRVVDLEDAHRLDIVSLAELEDLFLPFFRDADGYNSAAYVRKKMAALRDANQKAQFLRAKWIGWMTGRLAVAFLAEEEALLAGTLERDLLGCLPAEDRELINRINALSVARIYNHPSVVELEVAGYHIIGGLLAELVPAVLWPARPKSRKTRQLIPAQFPVRGDGVYADVQSAVDFVAGMTDLFALDLYRKITGITVSGV